MGAVYLATQQPLGRKIALKVLKESLVHDDVSVRRFYKEAQAVAQLNHPNIVTIYDFGTGDNGILYLAMELLEGVELLELMGQKRHLTWEESLPIVLGTCRALAAAHSEKIVHRDLKPDNIMLIDSDLGQSIVKVLDFGLAKMVHPDSQKEQKRLTSADVIMGTPGYMSPEQINGQDIDARTDIYSLGVLWWEMLVGRPIFDEDTPIKILVRHIQDDPEPPSSARPNLILPPEGETLLLRFLSKDPDSRPRDGEHALSLIQGLMGENWSIAPLARAPVSSQPHDKALEDIVDEWAANFTGQISTGKPKSGSGPSAQDSSANFRPKSTGTNTIIATPVGGRTSLSQEVDLESHLGAAPVEKYTPDPWLVREGGGADTGPAQVRMLERSAEPDSPSIPEPPGSRVELAAGNVDIDAILFELQNPQEVASPQEYENPQDIQSRPEPLALEPGQASRTLKKLSSRKLTVETPSSKHSVYSKESRSASKLEAESQAQENDKLKFDKANEERNTLPAKGDGSSPDTLSREHLIKAKQEEADPPSVEKPADSLAPRPTADPLLPSTKEVENTDLANELAPQPSTPEPAPSAPSAEESKATESNTSTATTNAKEAPSDRQEAVPQEPVPGEGPPDKQADNEPSEDAPTPSAPESDGGQNDDFWTEVAPSPATPAKEDQSDSKETLTLTANSEGLDTNSDFAQLFLNPQPEEEMSDSKHSSEFWGEMGAPDSGPLDEYWSDLDDSGGKNKKKPGRKEGKVPFVMTSVLITLVVTSVLYMLDPVFLQPYRDGLTESYHNAKYAIGQFFEELISGPPPPPMKNPLGQVREEWIAELGVPKAKPGETEAYCQDRYLKAKKLFNDPIQTHHKEIYQLLREALLANPEFLPAAALMIEDLASFDAGGSILKTLPTKKLLRYGLQNKASRNEFLRAKGAVLLQNNDAQNALMTLSEKSDIQSDTIAFGLQVQALNTLNPKMARNEIAQYQGATPSSMRWERETGVLHRLEGNWPQALKSLNRRLQMTPNDSRTIIQLALLDVDRNNPKRGLAKLLKHLKRNPWDHNARTLAVGIEGEILRNPGKALKLALARSAKSPQSREALWQLDLKTAVIDSSQGNYERTRKALQSLGTEKAWKNRAELHFAWGQHLLRREKPQLANRAFSRAQDLESNSQIAVWLHTHSGEASLGEKKNKEAREKFSWAMDLNSAFLPAHVGSLLSSLKAGKVDTAAAAMNRILQGDPTYHDDTQDLSLPPGRHETVERMRNEILKIEPTDENYILREFGLGIAAFYLNENDMARKTFDRVKKFQKGNDVYSEFLLASLDLRNKDYKNALDRIDKLQSLGHRGQGLWALRAKAELELNMLNQAQRSLGKMNNATQFLSLQNEILGEIALRNGEETNAENHFTTAIQKSPHNQRIKNRISDFYRSK
jgi:serine/threonine protein kinase/tetratricopeptide (TPR) repeat protein